MAFAKCQIDQLFISILPLIIVKFVNLQRALAVYLFDVLGSDLMHAL